MILPDFDAMHSNPFLMALTAACTTDYEHFLSGVWREADGGAYNVSEPR